MVQHGSTQAVLPGPARHAQLCHPADPLPADLLPAVLATLPEQEPAAGTMPEGGMGVWATEGPSSQEKAVHTHTHTPRQKNL